MAQQAQPPNNPHAQHKHRPWLRWVILIIALTMIGVAAIIWVENSKTPWLTILPIIIFTALGVVIALFQWLFPISSSSAPAHHTLQYNEPQLATVGPPVQPIFVHVPTTQQLPPIIPSQEKAAYRGIVGFPPLTDSRTIQQREKLVKEIYAQLLSPEVTAIVLTGIGGVGKSTLAALIHRYAEEQRRPGIGPFTAEALWLRIDPAVTMTDLVGTIFDAFGKPPLDMDSLTPQNLAVALFNALNTTASPRLLILDQFENLLDTQTGYALEDRAGVGEWLDALNSQPCRCRVLLTSRLWPQGTREYPPTYMQEYHSRGLEIAEGIELLHKQGVGLDASEAELRMAVERCAGHAFALTLLASFLRRNRSLSLATLYSNPTYAQLWTGNIARNLLNSIYTQQLNDVQRKLLLAFSIYREPVPLDAATTLLDISADVSEDHTLPALDGLLRQHLLQASGEGRYQLHAIVADYARNRYTGDHEQQQSLQEAHTRAAHYYLQQAAQHYPPRDQRHYISDVQPLIEAIWHLCQAEQWQQAYNLVEQENIFNSLKRWGGNTILLELYELLLPIDKWHPQPDQVVRIYNNLGDVNRTLSQFARAQEYLERALSLCKEQNDLSGESRALNNLGQVYARMGKREQAREHFEQALNICTALGDREGEVINLNGLAGIHRALAQRKRSLDYCEQALSISREIGDLGEEATTLSHLGEIYSALGQRKQALDDYEQALLLYKEVGDRGGEGWTLNNLGKLYDDLGQKEKALTYFEQALSIRKEIGDHYSEGRTLKNLGRVYFDLGQKEQALTYLEQSLQICKNVDRWGEGKTLNNLGQVYASIGPKERALEYFERALTIRRDIGDRSGQAATLNLLGHLYTELNQQQQALQCYQQALSVHKEIDDPRGKGTTLHNLGTLYCKQEQYNIALACFLLAKTIFTEVQSSKLAATQSGLEELQKKVGDKAFEALLVQVEPQLWQIIEQALHQ